MQNLIIDHSHRVWTSKKHELDRPVKYPLRLSSTLTGKTVICDNEEALLGALQRHVDAVPHCFTTAQEVLVWLTQPDSPPRDAVSKHDAKVRQMIDPGCIYL